MRKVYAILIISLFGCNGQPQTEKTEPKTDSIPHTEADSTRADSGYEVHADEILEQSQLGKEMNTSGSQSKMTPALRRQLTALVSQNSTEKVTILAEVNAEGREELLEKFAQLDIEIRSQTETLMTLRGTASALIHLVELDQIVRLDASATRNPLR